MDRADEVHPPKIGKGLIACLAVLLALLLASMILSRFDNTTELLPGHEDVLNFCFAIAGLAGLVCGGFAVHQSRRLAVWHRVTNVCCLAVAGFLAGFLFLNPIADIIEGRIHFPPASTKTFTGLLAIGRAYRTHGKGQSWNIQTTPMWSNLDVTEADYQFMLTHRAPEDHGNNPDEISSHGFFCARVTMQQSGNALRVMHAGDQKLPAGTVIVCPTTSPGLPRRQGP